MGLEQVPRRRAPDKHAAYLCLVKPQDSTARDAILGPEDPPLFEL